MRENPACQWATYFIKLINNGNATGIVIVQHYNAENVSNIFNRNAKLWLFTTRSYVWEKK
jgi:hypothetical protein